ncbi:urea ABC transporter substrate-binding protein [Leptodesmis sp.]|uniref:urea ABC transporter substrate-binding protein n=1 Tax=Leptodesmis sp. TaxID=3100501 RepID=UPI0040535B16
MVRIGILHSLTGSMTISERSLVDAALMAIAEINQAGGVLGQIIEPVIEDGASDRQEFVRKAEKLLHQDQVATMFGCWTSASRKAIVPLVEAANILLWYPVQYEGLEASNRVFYFGCCLNQQVEPAVAWLLQHYGDRLYLLGSNYVFPRTIHKMVHAQLQQAGGTVVGEVYVPLSSKAFEPILQEILQAKPDVIFNTLSGDSNLAFYRAYREAGCSPETLPVMAVSVAEPELQSIAACAEGTYASWSYFQSLPTPQNQRFVQAFQARYGGDRVTSDPIAAAYSQVYAWKQAVETAQSFATAAVRQAAYGQLLETPGGTNSD